MYKLLVVDDEFNIRDGIANAIAWDGICAQVVGTAVDGADALKKAEVLLPDIVITDVNMDNMDGLDLTDRLKQKYPSMKVIILSGYDEFEYVRRALELKVCSYVMKPVRSKELIETVRNAIAEIEEDKKLREKINSMEMEIDRNKALLTERFLFDLIHGNIEGRNEFDSRAEFLNVRFERAYYTCFLVSIPEYQAISREQGIKKLQSVTYSIREIFCNVMNDYEIRCLVGEQGNLTLLCGGGSENPALFREQLTKELEQAAEDAARLLGIAVTVTVGGVYDSPLEISRSFREASLALEHNSIAGKAGIIHIDDVPAAAGSRYIYPVDKEQLLLRSLIDASEDKICTIIGDLFDEMENQKYTKSRMRVDILGLMGMVSRKAMDMGTDVYQLYSRDLLDPYTALERYGTRSQMENWFRNIVMKTVYEIRNRQVSNVKSVIKKANEYLERNYTNPDFSLVAISDYLHLSSSYFSRLYRKETGESFIEALTNIRLQKSKALLKETNERISAISESIGYTDSKYFCTLFRKYTGLTPMEFRET